MMAKVNKIKKRNGTLVDFDKEKIVEAIFKAEKAAVKDKARREKCERLANIVTARIYEKFSAKNIPSVEDIQDIVEKVLMEEGHSEAAKAYILYRHERSKLRKAKAMMGVEDDIKLSLNAIKVLERRYLLKDNEGKVIETPGQMFRRVAKHIASADKKYGVNPEKVKDTEEKFYELMTKLYFLPNSPTFTGAGTKVGQLAACFVLPVEDSMEGIFDALKYTALIHKSGGGTGFSFSRLRPRNDRVLSTKGVASGPVSFMTVFDTATETIKQGGTRRGANMGILRVDHPDIMEFIVAKEKTNKLNNFNISVAITDEFMEAVQKNKNYELINPKNNKVVAELNARRVFNLIVTMAWKNGEPGILFLDRVNEDNPTPAIGKIESTNPCGEQPLLPYESCNLGSINLSRMLKKNNGKYEFDYDLLKETVHAAVHFMDNVIDVNKYPLKKIEQMVKGNRKIGLGVMGWADALYLLGIPYNSEKALTLAEEVIKFIHDEGRKASVELAKKRGTFPNFKDSIYDKKSKYFKGVDMKLRNATITTIAPTGTLSIMANCSSGIEPVFAISYIRNIMDNTELLEVNPVFKNIAKKEGFYSDELMKKIAKKGSIQHIEGIPEKIKKICVIAHDISPEWHVKMQAAFQKYTDNAVSKTVNFPSYATTQDVEKAFMLAYKLGCKGITVYRYGSRERQILNIEQVNRSEAGKKEVKKEKVPKGSIKVSSEYVGGCPKCNL